MRGAAPLNDLVERLSPYRESVQRQILFRFPNWWRRRRFNNKKWQIKEGCLLNLCHVSQLEPQKQRITLRPLNRKLWMNEISKVFPTFGIKSTLEWLILDGLWKCRCVDHRFFTFWKESQVLLPGLFQLSPNRNSWTHSNVLHSFNCQLGVTLQTYTTVLSPQLPAVLL